MHVIDGHTETAPAEFCGAEPIFRVGTFFVAENNTPSKDQTVSSGNGIFAFANVPPGRVTVFAYARPTDGADLVEIGHVELVSLPDTITIGDVWVACGGSGEACCPDEICEPGFQCGNGTTCEAAP